MTRPRKALVPALLSPLLVAVLLSVPTRSFADDANTGASAQVAAAGATDGATAAGEVTAAEEVADAAETPARQPTPSAAAQTDDPDEPRRPGRRPPRMDSEPGGDAAVAIGQMIIGTLVAGASGGIGFTAALYGAFGGSVPLLLAGAGLTFGGPAIAGRVVCAMGRKSAAFEGGCGWAIGGAYLGLFALLPLTALTSEESRFVEGGVVSPLVILAGYSVGAALGATIGWHASKRPRHDGFALQPITRAGPPPAALAAWTEPLARPAARNAGGAPQLAVPLLAVAF